MQIAIPVAVLFILTILFLLLNPGSGRQSKKNDPAGTPPMTMIQESPRDAIIEKLTKLAGSKPQDNIKIGAMCYKVALPPNRAEYCCPVCGEKTLYSNNSETAHMVLVEIPEIRRLIKSISDSRITVAIDESGFCSKCNPDVKSRQLCLSVSYKNDSLRHTTCPVTKDDVRLIKEFISGEQTHKMERDAEAPLVNYIKRLEELLGISIRKQKPENR